MKRYFSKFGGSIAAEFCLFLVKSAAFFFEKSVAPNHHAVQNLFNF
jgi:hypothetical protein